MESSDFVVFSTTLWTRAADIPCHPRARVAIHSVAILGAIGGWRLGALLGMKYGQFVVAVVRDPATGSTRPVLTPTVHQNKRKTNRIKKGQDEK